MRKKRCKYVQYWTFVGSDGSHQLWDHSVPSPWGILRVCSFLPHGYPKHLDRSEHTVPYTVPGEIIYVSLKLWREIPIIHTLISWNIATVYKISFVKIPWRIMLDTCRIALLYSCTPCWKIGVSRLVFPKKRQEIAETALSTMLPYWGRHPMLQTKNSSERRVDGEFLLGK